MSTTQTDRIEAMMPALLHQTGIDGVYLRTALYEQIVSGLDAFITKQREEGTEVLRFPPVMSRKVLEATGYAQNFPHMLGGVCCVPPPPAGGGDAGVGPGQDFDWAHYATTADLVLTPAACYPVYSFASARGPVPEKGLVFDVLSDCFRREPSKRLDRLQSFRMREYVCIGTPEQVLAFRERWKQRGAEMAKQLGLTFWFDKASDPFFGRMGLLLARRQVEQALKFELLVPIYSPEQPTACMSFNFHQDHFGTVANLKSADGALSNTGCAAFGLDRLTLAMFATHGIDLATWPASVKEALGL